jgi:putative ABC transport system substrate-binding protein
MKRRGFFAILGGAAALPLAARAQQARAPIIGFLSTRGASDSANVLVAFRRGLEEAGVVEGRDATIEFRWANGQYDRLPALAAELAGRPLAVMVATGGDPSAFAAKAATTTIPIVFSFSNDPVKAGLVASLNRPGSNVTGYSLFIGEELEAKRLEVLLELMPKAGPVGLLVDPKFPTGEPFAAYVQATAQKRGTSLVTVRASTDGELDAAFAAFVQQRVAAILIGTSSFFTSRHRHIVALSAQHAIPIMSDWREYVAAGALASYGTSLTDVYLNIGRYAGRIVKGAKPAELPVIQPTKFELVINLKTAKALGLTIPQAMLVAADEVIE